MTEKFAPTQATAADLDAVCETFADGFHDDPLWGWAFGGDAVQRRERQLQWFRIVVSQGIEYGSVWMTPNAEAATLWIPAGMDELSAEREAELLAFVERDCADRANVLFETFEQFEKNHPRDRESHYLSLLATANKHRGRGIGMALLRENLAALDQVGEAAYLESTNPANLARYESVGFARHGEFVSAAGAPLVTTMWREPATKV
ncbi:GNAT family N-acetyltransferase [Leucobacter sp. UT-8R-CII-1-4]|uniref:GNAT family N-acetyltransferase n=1 Tax=Leucobacter sp. UT-8R-CII-1-4 TaxID=3040075 RepID=UPI0024A873F2|nr:GNAT family N-acetyltransferase [Leucobacter sp. UT-8R-CII-1-4]MDI6022314.1 GNAT family N-acetyltransferase [Leucobacter sp. UT-8R-CII-1-4]